MKRVYYHSGFKQPLLNWRVRGERRFHTTPMAIESAGRWAGESLWAAGLPVESHTAVEFYINDGAHRDPANRWYESNTQLAFLQDGQLFTYRPAAHVEPARRAYDVSKPTRIYSQCLGEWRTFRVYLPRGYRQHVQRRYPVAYMQDGQNIFESGGFGSWNAQRSIDRCIARGEVEELIVVAVDHGPGRWNDYVPAEDGGNSERYARFLSLELKPHIDRLYRTRTGAQDTALIGSSLGGVAALNVAWDRFHQFGKVGSLSGSWWLKKFQHRMLNSTKRPLKIYLDSGNAGPYNDCIHHTLALRDGLTGRLGYRQGHDLFHLVGDQQSHTEAAWGHRLTFALRFLFPAQGAPEEVAALPLPLRRAA
jgi:enterochelin esterase-like enzyme